MPISKDQARDLAKTFRDVSNALAEYRFTRWGTLTAAQRQRIEDAEWTLLNYSSDFITTAVGIALPDLEQDLRSITGAIAKAKKVIATVDTVKDVLKVTASLIVLGGAIASKEPRTIFSAVKDLLTTSRAALSA